jgi:aspartate racemase
MKKIGLVGGTSWSSTIDYYRFINEGINEKLGGLNFAECIIYSVNFADFRTLNAKHNWDGAFELLAGAALKLKAAGAEVILLGANTAHIVADRVKEHVQLPLIDIRVATAEAIISRGLQKVDCWEPALRWNWTFTGINWQRKGLKRSYLKAGKTSC